MPLIRFIGSVPMWFPFTTISYLSGIQLTDGDGSAKSLTGYVGLDPVDFQSGTLVYRRSTISKQGSQRLRKYLFLGPLGGVRAHNPLREFHQRLIDRGRPYKVALIACARKILVWSWAIFVNNTTFDTTRFAASD